MTPIGPFASPWTKADFFIVSEFRHGQEIILTVPNGAQRSEGMPHASLRDAKQWLKDNGFVSPSKE